MRKLLIMASAVALMCGSAMAQNTSAVTQVNNTTGPVSAYVTQTESGNASTIGQVADAGDGNLTASVTQYGESGAGFFEANIANIQQGTDGGAGAFDATATIIQTKDEPGGPNVSEINQQGAIWTTFQANAFSQQWGADNYSRIDQLDGYNLNAHATQDGIANTSYIFQQGDSFGSGINAYVYQGPADGGGLNYASIFQLAPILGTGGIDAGIEQRGIGNTAYITQLGAGSGDLAAYVNQTGFFNYATAYQEGGGGGLVRLGVTQYGIGNYSESEQYGSSDAGEVGADVNQEGLFNESYLYQAAYGSGSVYASVHQYGLGNQSEISQVNFGSGQLEAYVTQTGTLNLSSISQLGFGAGNTLAVVSQSN
jgi:hypothetical protein